VNHELGPKSKSPQAGFDGESLLVYTSHTAVGEKHSAVYDSFLCAMFNMLGVDFEHISKWEPLCIPKAQSYFASARKSKRKP
jgi:hypothetical protein